jgi:hypothetical protein
LHLTVVGAVVYRLGEGAFATSERSLCAFHEAVLICAALFVPSGAIRIADLRRDVEGGGLRRPARGWS